MQNSVESRGLVLAFVAGDSNKPSTLWRPWDGSVDKSISLRTTSVLEGLPEAKPPKLPQITHPVKLFWPKTRCFDYLYRDAEILLRNYPVQATICPFDESSSDEEGNDGDEEEGGEVEKEPN